MKTTIVFGVLLALAALALSDEVNFEEAPAPKNELDEVEGDADATVSALAASSQVNCRCQCSSITFLDKFGNINGNCRSSDTTGAVWCYVDPRFSQCADLRRSTRTTSQWSYQACATPDLASPQCGGGFGGNNGGFGGNNGGFGGSTGGFGGSTGGFGGSTGGFGGSTGGFGGSTGGFGGSTGGFGGSNGNFGGSTGGFGGSTGGFGGSTGFNNGIPNTGFNTGLPNQGFNNNNNNGGFVSGGIRSPSNTAGSPLIGTGTNGFSVGSGAASGPEGFPFQENGGFQAVLSLAERKATAAKAGEEPATEAPAAQGDDSVSFSR